MEVTSIATFRLLFPNTAVEVKSWQEPIGQVYVQEIRTVPMGSDSNDLAESELKRMQISVLSFTHTPSETCLSQSINQSISQSSNTVRSVQMSIISLDW